MGQRAEEGFPALPLLRPALVQAGPGEGECYRWNCVPTEDTWKPKLPVPESVTLFGNRIFTEIIKVRGATGVQGPDPI